ncbi:MAG: hypothetical protein ACJ71F_16090 [Nitrososphaeraceae archaeon]
MQYLALKEKNEAPLESQKKEEVEEVAQRSGSLYLSSLKTDG